MGVAAALFIGGAASAATVKVTYEGTIDYLEGFVSTPIALGQRITLTQIIDTDASPLGQAGNPSEYPFLGGSFTNHDLGHTSVYDAAIAPHPIYNSIIVFADSASGDQYKLGKHWRFSEPSNRPDIRDKQPCSVCILSPNVWSVRAFNDQQVFAIFRLWRDWLVG